MQEIGSAEPVLSKDEIIARWGGPGGPLSHILDAARDPLHESERLIQIRKARYNWRFIGGDQFIAPGFTSDYMGQETIDFVSADAYPDPDENGSQIGTAYPVNFSGGDCYKFVAVMGQGAPKVKALPDVPDFAAFLDPARDRVCLIAQQAEFHVVTDPEVGVDFSKVVHADERFTHHRPLVAGDVVTTSITIESIVVRAGIAMVTTRAEIVDVDGAPVSTVVSTLAVREQ